MVGLQNEILHCQILQSNHSTTKSFNLPNVQLLNHTHKWTWVNTHTDAHAHAHAHAHTRTHTNTVTHVLEDRFVSGQCL